MQAWGGPGPGHDWFGSEHGIYLDSKEFVWLGGNGPQDGMILKYARDGRFVMQIGHEGSLKASNDTTQLGRPADTAYDAAVIAQEGNWTSRKHGRDRMTRMSTDTGALGWDVLVVRFCPSCPIPSVFFSIVAPDTERRSVILIAVSLFDRRPIIF